MINKENDDPFYKYRPNLPSRNVPVNPTFFSGDILNDQSQTKDLERIRNKRRILPSNESVKSIPKVEISGLFRNESRFLTQIGDPDKYTMIKRRVLEMINNC